MNDKETLSKVFNKFEIDLYEEIKQLVTKLNEELNKEKAKEIVECFNDYLNKKVEEEVNKQINEFFLKILSDTERKKEITLNDIKL